MILVCLVDFLSTFVAVISLFQEMNITQSHSAVVFRPFGLRFFVAFFLFVSLCHSALGQRTSDRQFLLGLDGGTAVAGGRGFTADVYFGQYLLNSRWGAGVDYIYRVSSGVSQFLVYGEWSYRLCSSRNRAFCLYGGVGAHSGYELSRYTFDDYVEDTQSGAGTGSGSVSVDIGSSSGYDDQGFLYGIRFLVEAEMFVSRRVALVATARAPVIFNSSGDEFSLVFGAGIRFNL